MVDFGADRSQWQLSPVLPHLSARARCDVPRAQRSGRSAHRVLSFHRERPGSRRKAAIPEKINAIGERLDQILESTLANRFVTYWRITIMLVAEGHRFLQETNVLAAGSPTHSLRILSYGLANLVTKGRNDSNLEGIPAYVLATPFPSPQHLLTDRASFEPRHSLQPRPIAALRADRQL